MPPGAEQVIDAAANSGHGWEAVALAVILIAMITALWLMNKLNTTREEAAMQAALAREERLADRVTTLEQSLENNLTLLVKDTTEALVRNSDAMRKTSEVMDEVKNCLIANTKEAAKLHAKLESSACCLSSMGLLSEETQRKIEDTKNHIREAQNT